MKHRLVLIIGLLLIVAALATSVAGMVNAQGLFAPRWQYATVTYDVRDGAYGWTTVVPEGASEISPPREITQALWDQVAASESRLAADYLAVMGMAGYELVDVTEVSATLLIYTFKRPMS